MTSISLSKFLRTDKVIPGYAPNAQSQQWINPQMAGVIQDPSAYTSPLAYADLTDGVPGNAMAMYDVETNQLRPAVNTQLRFPQDAMFGSPLTGLSQEYGFVAPAEVRAQPGQYQAYVNSFMTVTPNQVFHN